MSLLLSHPCVGGWLAGIMVGILYSYPRAREGQADWGTGQQETRTQNKFVSQSFFWEELFSVKVETMHTSTISSIELKMDFDVFAKKL